MDYKPHHFELPENDTLLDAPGVDPYVFSQDIAIAIDVAFATGRPLLVEGKPGCGKSRLAEAIAAIKGWHFQGKAITSRTTLEELTNDVNHLQRLHDAHSAGADRTAMKPDWAYNRPGIFWWAFDHESAKELGQNQQQHEAVFKGTRREQDDGTNHMVLLIDEIDKAEPDLPNDLLDTIDRRRIEMPDGSFINSDKNSKTFTIITSNRERSLPQAFLRRCVSLFIEEPNFDDLKKIAKNHLKTNASDTLIDSIANKIIDFRDKAELEDLRAPGTSEFLDALRACIDLEITPDEKPEIWAQVEKSILRKKS
jgi:MoxR-like ATPase